MKKLQISFNDIKSISVNDQLNLWFNIVGTNILYEPVLSPFRPDSHIGGQVYLHEHRNKILLADHKNTTWHNIDVWAAYVHLFGREVAYRKIYENSKFVTETRQIIDKKCYINYEPLDYFFKSTTDYFATYKITEEQLWADGVRNVKKLRLNKWDKQQNKRLLTNWNVTKCHALYTFPSEHCKLYFPYEQSKFPVCNTDKNDVYEIKQGGKNLIIGSSYKDIRCAVNHFGGAWNGIAPQTETLPKKLENLFNWTWVKQHDRILVIGDNDATGILFQNTLVDYLGAESFVFPNVPKVNKFGKTVKDFAELMRL